MFKDMSLQATSTTSTIPLNDELVGNLSTLSPNNSYGNSSDAINSTSTVFSSTSLEQHDASNEMLETSILCIKGIIFVSIIVGAVLGNALVIISVHRNRKLR